MSLQTLALNVNTSCSQTSNFPHFGSIFGANIHTFMSSLGFSVLCRFINKTYERKTFEVVLSYTSNQYAGPSVVMLLNFFSLSLGTAYLFGHIFDVEV